MRAGIGRELGIPHDDIGLREIVDGFYQDFLAVFFHLAVVGPDVSRNSQRNGTRCACLVHTVEFVRVVRLVVGVNRKIVARSGWTVEEMIADHVSVIRGPSTGHCYGDNARMAVRRVIELALRGPVPTPSIKVLQFSVLRLDRLLRLTRCTRKYSETAHRT